jgi:nuclear transport factor 2 (NTF2) superfamily protein
VYYAQFYSQLTGSWVRSHMSEYWESAECGLRRVAYFNEKASELRTELRYRLVDESGREVKE